MVKISVRDPDVRSASRFSVLKTVYLMAGRANCFCKHPTTHSSCSGDHTDLRGGPQ